MYLLVSLLVILYTLVYVYPNDDQLMVDQKNREHLNYFFVAIVLIFFCGLRIKYNDTITYLLSYNGDRDASSVREFWRYGDKSLGANPGFRFLNALMKEYHFDGHLFLFAYAVIDVGIALWFIKKYTKNLALGVFFFYLTSFIFMFAGLKQATAASIALIGVHCFFRGYWLWYGVVLYLAITIHPYVVMLILVPVFRFFRPWSWFTYVCIICFGMLGLFLVHFATFLADMAQMMGDSFTEEEVVHGRGVNTFRFLAFVASIVASFFFQRELFPKVYVQKTVASKVENLLKGRFFRRKFSLFKMIMYVFRRHKALRPDEIVNVYFHFSLLGCSFMFMAMFGNQILIGRLPQYVCTMRCLELSYLFSYLWAKGKGAYRTCFNVGLFCYVAFFVFEHMINKNFGQRYDCIDLGRFWDSFIAIF